MMRSSLAVHTSVLLAAAIATSCGKGGHSPSDGAVDDSGPRAPVEPPPGSPVALHGRLHVEGLQLVDEHGAPVQLRGVSDQGIQWFPFGTCIGTESLSFLASPSGMNVDVIRVPVYVTEGGYLHDPAGMIRAAKRLADEAIALGLYVLIDWHVTSFDPNDHLAEARAFWTDVATTYAAMPNVLYEVANEPSGVTWSRITEYADVIIPHIRARDPLAPIIVGTPDDSGELAAVADAPLGVTNVLYTFHFYAASMTLDQITPYLDRIPIFVTEWGASSYSGDAPDDYANAAAFADALNGPAQTVSFIAWSFTDDSETSALLAPGTCDSEGHAGGPWTTSSLSPSGTFMRALLIAP